MHRSAFRKSLLGLAAATLALAGCATQPGEEAADDRLSVVASTNVYGDIASAIAGDLASVTSIVTSAAHDPHSYEASAQDQLALSKADVVIHNGGGYDPFIGTLLYASGSAATVITAAEVSGLIEGDEHEGDHTEDPADERDGEAQDHIEGFNEHVWYSFHAVEAIAGEIAHELGRLDPANAAAYDSNHRAFAVSLEALEGEAGQLRSLVEGRGVVITEPAPLYLLSEVGLQNRTPDGLSEAVEEGGDVPPLVLRETLALIADGTIALVAYNDQTAGRETEQLIAAAEEAGVPVVSFSETLPEGADYSSWMSENLGKIRAVLE